MVEKFFERRSFVSSVIEGSNESKKVSIPIRLDVEKRS